MRKQQMSSKHTRRGVIQVREEDAWKGTWQYRTSSKNENQTEASDMIGIHEAAAEALVALLVHFPCIVYLGFVFWRKLLILRHGTRGGFGFPTAIFPDLCGSDIPASHGTCGRLDKFIKQTLLANGLSRVGGQSKWIPSGEDQFQFVLQCVASQQIDCLSILITQLNLQLTDDDEEEEDEETQYAMPLIHASLAGGNLSLIKLLLKGGASVDERDDDYERSYRTTLFLACLSNSSPEVVSLLLKNGASVDAMTRCPPHVGASCLTPLHVTSSGSLAQLLMDHGAKVDGNSFSASPLQMAAGRGCVEVVKVLLENGASANKFDRDLWTPLRQAADGGHLSVVKLLVEEGESNVNFQDCEKQTALSRAVAAGEVEIVEYLLKHGASIRIADAEGDLPLHHAMNNNMSEEAACKTVSLLSRAESWTISQCTTENQSRYTPLGLAVQAHRREVVRTLLDLGANVNYQEQLRGYTVLHEVNYNHYGVESMLKVLVAYGADPTIKNSRGETALDYVGRNEKLTQVLRGK